MHIAQVSYTQNDLNFRGGGGNHFVRIRGHHQSLTQIVYETKIIIRSSTMYSNNAKTRRESPCYNHVGVNHMPCYMRRPVRSIRMMFTFCLASDGRKQYINIPNEAQTKTNNNNSSTHHISCCYLSFWSKIRRGKNLK